MAVQATVVFFAARRERPIASRQSALSLPGDLADLRRHALQLGQLRLSDPRRVPVGPGALSRRCRKRALPILVIEPRRTVSPLERSPGTRPM